MAKRLPNNSEIISLPFGQVHHLEDGTEIKLHPAGHILGSAQLAAKNQHGSFLYTGDFKLRPGLSAETCVTPQADTLYTDVDMRERTAIVVGTEKVGLSETWMAGADVRCQIPMFGQADSLNVSTAATLLLYEVVRQRRTSAQ